MKEYLFEFPMLQFFFLLQILVCCGLPHEAIAQKTKVEFGPFEPFGGKRLITYYQDSLPVELKEYDILGNLRRQVRTKGDAQNRILLMEEQVYDEAHRLVGGFIKRRTYKDSLDYGGKTVYKQYDSLTKKMVTVQPLITHYSQKMISAPPISLRLDSFYKKYTDAFGIPVVSSRQVPDAALLVARDIVNYMLLKRPDVRAELVRRNSRVLVMASIEMETDLPERKDWKKPEPGDPRLTPGERASYYEPNGIGSMTDRQYWNQRARGMGGNEVSCAEENLLGYAGTKYFGENILVHEFSHTIMSAIRTTDTALYADIQIAYEHAKASNLYKDQYAINTIAEYWAEGTQWWFWCNMPFIDNDIHLQSPHDLQVYDPALYRIFEKVYTGHYIPADVYYNFNNSSQP